MGPAVSQDDAPDRRIPRWAVLPWDGRPHLCAVAGGQVEPLTVLPGRDQPQYFPSVDGRQLAILDHKGKRAGLLDVLSEAPWVKTVLPFAFLGPRQVGHTAMPVSGTLIVGGHSKSGESLWRRAANDPMRWTLVPLPEQLGFPGKAIDGLHLHDGALIVVDDLIMPLWMMVYAVDEAGELTLGQVEQLPVHTTYERVTHSSLGPKGLAALSRGINHGTFSTHVWVLDLVRYREIACWSSWRSNRAPYGDDNGPPTDGQSDARDALLSARMVVECAGHLVVACGPAGAMSIRLGSHTRRDDEHALSMLQLVGLASCDSIIVPSPAAGDGIFLVGKSADGNTHFEWLSAQVLRAHGSPDDSPKGLA